MTIEALSCPKCGSASVSEVSDGGTFRCSHCQTLSYFVPTLNILSLSFEVECPECNHSNSVQNRFCSACGAGIYEGMYEQCNFCLGNISREVFFCPECGELLQGIPASTVEEVNEFVRSMAVEDDYKIYASVSSDHRDSEILVSQLEDDETVLWGFTPPADEGIRTEDGHTPYVLNQGLLCKSGFFVATTLRLIAYSPQIEARKSLFSHTIGQTEILTSCAYEAIRKFEYSDSIRFPREAAQSAVKGDVGLFHSGSDVPRAVYEAHERNEDPLCDGLELNCDSGSPIQMVVLPNYPRSDLRKWEKLLRLTLGITRSDLEYQPF